MRHTLLALIAAASCAAAFAQAPQALGKVVEVRGLVTMSLGSNVATVAPETPVFDGARFVAGSSGGAELKLSGGCVVRLGANQAVAIDAGFTCDQQIAAIQTLTDTAVGAGSMFARNAIPALGFVALAGVVNKLTETKITPTPP
jgi:hypothetical protein